VLGVLDVAKSVARRTAKSKDDEGFDFTEDFGNERRLVEVAEPVYNRLRRGANHALEVTGRDLGDAIRPADCLGVILVRVGGEVSVSIDC
jgi:hypothetical protein